MIMYDDNILCKIECYMTDEDKFSVATFMSDTDYYDIV